MHSSSFQSGFSGASAQCQRKEWSTQISISVRKLGLVCWKVCRYSLAYLTLIKPLQPSHAPRIFETTVALSSLHTFRKFFHTLDLLLPCIDNICRSPVTGAMFDGIHIPEIQITAFSASSLALEGSQPARH